MQTGHVVEQASCARGDASLDVALAHVTRSYEHLGIPVDVQTLRQMGESSPPVGQAIFVPKYRRVEYLFDASLSLEEAEKYLTGHDHDGWAIWALVPLDRLGAAHVAFSRCVEFLQGWWTAGPLRVAFTEPEIP